MKELRKNGYFYGALIYVFAIPFHQKIVTIAIGLWAILSFLSFKKKNYSKNSHLLLLPLLYLLFGIGLFTSDDPLFRFLETKLSFLIFPLIFFLHRYDTVQRDKMLKTFVYALTVSGIICLVYATYRAVSFQNGELTFAANVLEGREFMESILYGGNYYFGKFFSVFHQTVYYGLYIAIAIVILLFRPDLFTIKRNVILALFFIGLLFLISNKSAILTLGVILLVRALTLKTSRYRKAAGLAIVGLVIGVVIMANPRTRGSVYKIVNGGLKIDKNARYGFAPRILSWDAAIDLIKERPFMGYGAGSVQEKLNEIYQKKGYTFPLRESFNAHNLWLQTWLENGLLAVLTLGLLFFILFRVGGYDINFLGFTLALVAVLFVNSFFESMFNRFSGISFFSFLACYILTNSRGGESEP